MILCLDVGNSQIYGGLFSEDDTNAHFQFRKTSKDGSSSDEFGIFLRSVLRENGYKVEDVTRIAICTVVPGVLHSLRGACQKYFNVEPFVLKAGVKTGLKIKYNNPLEVGSDRIANAIAVSKLYENKNAIVVDFGTATTFCVVTKNKEYLGGMILPGVRLGMEALESNTAKLPSVEIVRPAELIGRSTVESIQAGIYYSNWAAVTLLSKEIQKKYFAGEDAIVVGTGGFSRLFEADSLFDVLAPDLVLNGLYLALKMNL